ncbi:tetracycline resistance [Fusarium agapanthi]|uniref:Tetracycline resistance n=1 Tax=Fusarium agapanthi TaxID=1803897 RepID=A0A9P5EEP7_9HYPO|nr:tetracycline resistance [Fusarium agapanthi]
MSNFSAKSKILGNIFGEDRDAPEIDRLQLRRLLIDSIPTNKIRWGHRVKSIERGDTAAEHVISFFNDNSVSGFRAIIGADGAWSKVRPLLSSVKPEYSGKGFIEGSISHDNPSYTAALEHAGPGNMLAMVQHKIMAVQQLADCSYRFYMGMDAPEELYHRPLSHEDTEDIRQKFQSSPNLFAHWAPNLREYLTNAEGPFHAWPLYHLPTSSVSWQRVPGSTLLRDAAYLATRLVGEGVNMAMLDALMLAKTIVKYCTQNSGADTEDNALSSALTEYEK